MNATNRPEGRPATDKDHPTTFVTSTGALTVEWTIEAKAHVLAAARILELDPARTYQARHLFGLASRLDVAA